MSIFKEHAVEVRYSDDDYGKVFVVLPNMKMCKADRPDLTSQSQQRDIEAYQER